MKKEVRREEYSPCPLCEGDPKCFLCKGTRKYVSATWTEIIINEGFVDEDVIDAEIEVPLLETQKDGCSNKNLLGTEKSILSDEEIEE